MRSARGVGGYRHNRIATKSLNLPKTLETQEKKRGKAATQVGKKLSENAGHGMDGVTPEED